MNFRLLPITVLLAAATILGAYSSQAAILGTGTLTITAPGFPLDQAGPYQVSITAVSTGPNPGSSFNTFCLGTQVDYFPGTTYGYQISDVVQPVNSQPSGHDYVTWGTAWLYSQYRAGLIGDGSANDVKNDALQEAIWTLQGQSLSGITLSADSQSHPATLASDLSSFLSQAHTAALGASISSEYNNANGAFKVYALNMFTGTIGSPTWVQPQLVLVPETSTVLAGALLILPFGLSVVRMRRKACK